MKHQLWMLLALAGTASLEAAEKQPLTIQKAWEFKRVGTPTLSPDGRLVVVPIASTNMQESKLEADLWLYATDGSRRQQLTTHTADESNPIFSPDGRWIAFTSMREKDKSPQLYLLPVSGGEAKRITNVPTGVSEVRWFPDSTSLAFVSRVWPELSTWEEQGKRLQERDESKMTAKAWSAVPVTSWDIFVDDRQAHIYRINREGGAPEAITLKAKQELTRTLMDGEPTRYDISPDGKTVAYVADSNPGAEVNVDVYLLPIGADQAKNISSDNPAYDGIPRFSPNGRKLAYVRTAIPNFYADTRRLVFADADGSNAKVLFTDFDRSIGEFHWTKNGESFFAVIDDAGTSRLYELPVSGKPRAITTTKSYGSLAVSKTNGSQLIAVRQSFVDVPALVQVDARSGDSRVLSNVNEALDKTIAWGSYESVTYKGADGQDIQMWVNYPAGFDRSKKYPVFLMLHGGPHSAITDGMHWRWNAQVFASMGYVTAWHNFHGSSGFGQKFTDSINPDWLSKPYEDTIKAADWLSQQPWADKERMVAGGGSYGGYLASVLLGRSHPFKALIVHAGVYNLYTQSAADFGFAKRRHGEFWEKPEIFQKTSPHLQAANFKTPTLVVHGQLDYRVPVTHGLELFHTLQRLGVPSRFVYYPNENHWILKPQNSVYWYEEVSKWIQQYAPSGRAAAVATAKE